MNERKLWSVFSVTHPHQAVAPCELWRIINYLQIYLFTRIRRSRWTSLQKKKFSSPCPHFPRIRRINKHFVYLFLVRPQRMPIIFVENLKNWRIFVHSWLDFNIAIVLVLPSTVHVIIQMSKSFLYWRASQKLLNQSRSDQESFKLKGNFV